MGVIVDLTDKVKISAVIMAVILMKNKSFKERT